MYLFLSNNIIILYCCLISTTSLLLVLNLTICHFTCYVSFCWVPASHHHLLFSCSLILKWTCCYCYLALALLLFCYSHVSCYNFLPFFCFGKLALSPLSYSIFTYSYTILWFTLLLRCITVVIIGDMPLEISK